MNKAKAAAIAVLAAGAAALLRRVGTGQHPAASDMDESLIEPTSTPQEIEFDAIVRAGAASVGGIKVISTWCFGAEIAVRSRSGRGAWQAHVQYDPGTGHVNAWGTYPASNRLRHFRAELEGRLAEAW
ncbi:hypothetical protein [Streptomyces chartreusis]|uniref:hypothetical protein n=1 Tax=Streptomyces chartreusis TaxID=1969 RepID=UPI0036BDB513